MDDRTVDLGVVARATVRRWWLVLLAAAVAGGATYAASDAMEPVYQATATLELAPRGSATVADLDAQTLETLTATTAAVGGTEPVLSPAADAIGWSSWEDLDRQTQVAVVAGTQLLTVSVEHASPDVAAAAAEAVAEQLVLRAVGETDRAAAETRSFLRTQAEEAEHAIQARQEQITTLGAELSAAQLPAVQERISRSLRSVEASLTQWQANYATLLRLMRETMPADIGLDLVEPAQASSEPVRPDPILYTALAVGIGVLLAVGLATWLEARRTRRRTPRRGRALAAVPAHAADRRRWAIP